MEDSSKHGPKASSTAREAAWRRLLPRAVLGGLLMGLANLVPGISGGTMLLAAGIYPVFVESIAEISALRLRKNGIVLLGAVVLSATAAVLLFAGPVKDLVVERRWVMYSLFIGLTLGGIPVVWRMARPASTPLCSGAVGGFLAMAALSLAQGAGSASVSSGASNPVMLGVAGLAGASAMILPGVSGGYLLLVMGQYVPILAGIDRFKEALKGGDMGAVFEIGLAVVVPVGLGVVVGVVAVSSLLRWLLRRYSQATLGVLLGLLLGAVVGLWPFQQPVEAVVGQTVVKGQVLSQEMLAELELEDLPTERFDPSLLQMLAALGLVGLGIAATTAVDRFGSRDG